jgi:hypothetical protein
MKKSAKRLVVIVGIGLVLMMSMKRVFAESDSESFKDLSAEWWQWSLSIPRSVNPQLDETGDDAVAGQCGSLWFLAGVFGGGTAIRNMVFVAEGTGLFFPLINS